MKSDSLQDRARKVWIDRARGAMILCVVVFHFSGAVADVLTEPSHSFFDAIYKSIEMFNMPAFFILSGMLWPAHPRSFHDYFFRKVQRLIVPYFIFGSVAATMYLIFARRYNLRMDGWWQPFISIIHAGSWPDGNGFKFNAPLWFLPCMFVVEVIYWVISKCSGRFWQQIIIFFIVSSVWTDVPKLLPWGMSLAPKYLLFFMVGVFSSRLFAGDLMERCANRKVTSFLAGGSLIFLLMTYFHISGLWLVKTCLVSCSAIAFGASIQGRWLEWCGLSAMGIMLVHKPIISVAQPLLRLLAVLSPPMQIASACLIVFAVTCLSCVAVMLIRKYAPFAIGECAKFNRRTV